MVDIHLHVPKGDVHPVCDPDRQRCEGTASSWSGMPCFDAAIWHVTNGRGKGKFACDKHIYQLLDPMRVCSVSLYTPLPVENGER